MSQEKLDAIKFYKVEHPEATFKVLTSMFHCSHSTVSKALSQLDSESDEEVEVVPEVATVCDGSRIVVTLPVSALNKMPRWLRDRVRFVDVLGGMADE